MLNKRFRFHSRGGVRYVYKHGKTIRTAKVSLVHTKNTRGFQRFAVVVSKKVNKTAVGRNRIRRRVYEAIRLYKKTHDFSAKKDFIFIIYSKDFLTMDFKELESTIASLIEQSMVQ
ncbi:ribonuclease P protein component [Candidatus Saccharibacteria bacterium]|nr:ribonuclease P protein component [Candidatus Saccharibacteria bacterium]